MIGVRSLMSRNVIRIIKSTIAAAIAMSFFGTVAATIQMAVAPAAATTAAQGQVSDPNDINWG